MALRSSLFASLSTRGIAASAAAVLMVGGGVAVAQSGAPSDTDEPVIEDLGETDLDEGEEEDTACPDAASIGLDTANEAGDPDQPGVCPPDVEGADNDDANDDVIEDLRDPEDDQAEPVEQDDDVSEETADDEENAGDEENADVFSAWVESLDGEALGCLKGQLVSHFARQELGPTGFDPETSNPPAADDPQAIADFLETDGRGLPGQCAERILDDEGSEGSIRDLDDADVEGSSNESGPPDHAKERAANAMSNRPSHAGPKGDGEGPGKSGSAPGRAGKGNGDS